MSDDFDQRYLDARGTSQDIIIGTGPLAAPLSGIAELKADNAYHVQGTGNGITDDTQAFIDALAASDFVFVPRGKTYLIGDVDVNGKTIIGHGTIKKKSTSESAFHIKGNGSVIAGLTFNGVEVSGQPNTDIKLGDGSKNIRIQDCTFTSPIYSAIGAAVDTGSGGAAYVTRVNGVIIHNNIFKKLDTESVGYARPIFLHSVDNVTVTKNLIRDTDYDAIRLRENDGYVLIDGNQFINIGNPSWVDTQTRDAIDSYWSGSNLTITNNIVRTTACLGFDIKGFSPDGSYGSERIIITGNQIYNTRYSGISLAGDASYDGLGNYKHMKGVIVSQNIIYGSNQNNALGTGDVGDGGIVLKKLVKHATISFNHVLCGYGRGIYISNSDAGKGINKDIDVIGNKCINNGNNGDVACSGIFIDPVDDLRVKDNTCAVDTDMELPYQSTGMTLVNSNNGYTAEIHTWIVTDNILRNNIAEQIKVGTNGDRVNSIGRYHGNLIYGTTTSNYRQSWMLTKNVFFGSAVPAVANEGEFQVGDIIMNTNKTTARNIDNWTYLGSSAWISSGTGFGTTAQRPTLTSNDACYSYMDTTLAKMILWNGSAWLV